MTDQRNAFTKQPRVRGNDWHKLMPAVLGAWHPTQTVSVVIPAYQAHRTLPFTLAALAAQTYPSHLLEVVVVDDSSTPRLELPDLRPENTRIVTAQETWGPAHGRHTGALNTEGEVLHWLDSDMLPYPDQIEAQLRWHHLIDHAVVLGDKLFVDVSDGLPDLEDTLDQLRQGRGDDLFPDRWTSSHDWVDEYVDRTDGLVLNPTKSYLVHVGASASVRREVYLDAGGMDTSLKLGEDVELGYRLAQQGAVFIPDHEARSWHLGRSTLMQQSDDVNRYNRPYVTDRISDLRHWRTRGRSYTVPWVEIVVDARGRGYDEVRHSVNGALRSGAADVVVSLLGDWFRVDDDRRATLSHPDRSLKALRAEFEGEPRVHFVEEISESAFPAANRLRLPVGWSPGRGTIRRLGVEMARRDRGLISLLLPDGQVARLERTSAFRRAARLAGPSENLDDVVDQVSGTWWYDAPEEGFEHVSSVPDRDFSATPRPGWVRGDPRTRSMGAKTRRAVVHDQATHSAEAVDVSDGPGGASLLRARLKSVVRRLRAPQT
jgi:GT2 family glycosyltransferase